MKFIVYSKENCPYCYKVQQVLELCGKDFTTLSLGKDFTKEEFYARFGEGSTFPQVELDGKYIGNCNETVAYLKDQRMIRL